MFALHAAISAQIPGNTCDPQAPTGATPEHRSRNRDRCPGEHQMWATLLPTPNPAPQQKGKVCKNLRHQDKNSPFKILSSKETQPCGRRSLYMAAHNCPEGSIRVWQGCRSASVVACAKMGAQLGLSSRHSNDVMSLISLPQSHNSR